MWVVQTGIVQMGSVVKEGDPFIALPSPCPALPCPSPALHFPALPCTALHISVIAWNIWNIWNICLSWNISQDVVTALGGQKAVELFTTWHHCLQMIVAHHKYSQSSEMWEPECPQSAVSAMSIIKSFPELLDIISRWGISYSFPAYYPYQQCAPTKTILIYLPALFYKLNSHTLYSHKHLRGFSGVGNYL